MEPKRRAAPDKVKTMFKKLKKIRLSILLYFMLISLTYPTLKAFSSSDNRLLVFTDAMTIIALVLVLLGVVYSLVLHGDFDISRYYIQNGARSFRYAITRRDRTQEQKSIDEYLREARERREDSFNYPLFLGIVYLLAAAVIAYGFFP